MKIARSSFYREPVLRLADADLLDAIRAICDEFEAYGWRRVRVWGPPPCLRAQFHNAA